MPTARPRSVQWWLGALVMGVAASVLTLVLILCIAQVRREHRRARGMALRIAKATTMRLRAMRGESRELLARMAARPGVMALDPQACRAELAAVDFLPRYADLFLFDRSGRLVCSGNTDPQNSRISTLALPWIERELKAGRLQPNSLAMQPFAGQTMVMTSARTAAYSGTIVLLEFADVLGRAAFIPNAIIMILDRNGTIVARSERAEEWSGRNVSGMRFTRIGADSDEGFVAAEGLDGVSRQYAYVRIGELGWTVYGGVPSLAIVGSIREIVVTGVVASLAMIVILVVLTLALARRIGHPVRALASAAAAAGEGVYTRVAEDKGPAEVIALARAFNEMTDRRKRADSRMRALSERLLTVQEEERARIARELHDDLGQSLTALKMDIVGLLLATEQPSAVLPIRERILRTLDATVTSVQRISSELRPSVLDDLGLVAAIEAEARLFEERSGIECEVEVHGTVPSDLDSATAIYRIVQEALTNVARHANATRVELWLLNADDETLLEIHDDGRGVTLEEVSDPLSFGLIGIRERAEVIGGTVEIGGVADRGTVVSVRIPRTADARLA